MLCPHCQFEVAADFQFCPKCGKKLSRDCPQCSYVCPLEFLFCPKCGAALSQTMAVSSSSVHASRPATPAVPPSSAPLAVDIAEAERRPVTVLFADVVGFTTLAERLDPEELRSVMMSCFQALAEEIRYYD